MFIDTFTREFLIKNFIDCNLTKLEFCKLHNCSITTLKSALKRHNIKLNKKNIKKSCINNRGNIKNVTRDELISLYIDNHFSMKEISVMYSCDYCTVKNKLKKFNITIDRARRGSRNIKILTENYLRDEYVIKQKTIHQICLESGCSESSVNRRIKKYNIKKRTHRESCVIFNSERMKHNNPMKNTLVVERAKLRQKKMSQETRRKHAEATRERWASGKMHGVKVGKCKWFDFVTKNGKNIKCQGTWELAFAKWADKKNLNIESHVGRFLYFDDNNNKKFYYPDFWVKDWNCYVEIKNDYHYNLQSGKFENVKKFNKNINIKLLMLDDLKKMGIPFLNKRPQLHLI